MCLYIILINGIVFNGVFITDFISNRIEHLEVLLNIKPVFEFRKLVLTCKIITNVVEPLSHLSRFSTWRICSREQAKSECD